VIGLLTHHARRSLATVDSPRWPVVVEANVLALHPWPKRHKSAHKDDQSEATKAVKTRNDKQQWIQPDGAFLFGK
jgi:hypothetical protein